MRVLANNDYKKIRYSVLATEAESYVWRNVVLFVVVVVDILVVFATLLLLWFFSQCIHLQ